MCAKICLTVKKRRKVKQVSEIWALYSTASLDSRAWTKEL
jgi:hypothetical protein